MNQLKSKNFKSISIRTVALFLIFQPISFGLGKFELTISLIIGFVILLINKDVIVKKKIFLLFTFLISLIGTTYSVIFYEENFVAFQFFRTIIPVYIFLILMFADIKISFFEKIDKYLPFFILCALINALLYFFGSDLYNANLRLSEEVGRFFISYIDLLFFVSIIFLANFSMWLLPTVLMIIVTFSKEFFIKIIFIIFPFFFYFKNTFIKKFFFLLFSTLVIIYSFNSPIKERFDIFIASGDSFRYLEYENVISTIMTDPIRFLIGNGPGIKYKEAVYYDISFTYENSINFYYDVHNFYLKILLLFGFPLSFILIIFFYKILPLKNFFFRTLLVIHIITMNDAGFFVAIGFRYLIYKFSKYKKNFSHR
jgi:hypothetical protein